METIATQRKESFRKIQNHFTIIPSIHNNIPQCHLDWISLDLDVRKVVIILNHNFVCIFGGKTEKKNQNK